MPGCDWGMMSAKALFFFFFFGGPLLPVFFCHPMHRKPSGGRVSSSEMKVTVPGSESCIRTAQWSAAFLVAVVGRQTDRRRYPLVWSVFSFAALA
jgi:hypothetical protein